MKQKRGPQSALGISIREFARRDGCNDKLVRRAIAADFLQTFPDGTLDPELVGSGWRKRNRNAPAAADTGADKSQGPHLSLSAPDAADIDVELEPQAHGGALKRARRADEETDLDGDDVDELIKRLAAGELVSLADAERLKANALALRQLVNARRDAGALVEIELAERVLFENARRVRDAWLNWPVRVAPLLAADFDIAADALVEALTAHVHEQLAELGEPDPDFTG